MPRVRATRDEGIFTYRGEGRGKGEGEIISMITLNVLVHRVALYPHTVKNGPLL